MSEQHAHQGSLNPRHWEEIVIGSGVSETIAQLNFWTITDPREVDQLLGLNVNQRQKHSNQLAPGWAVAGVDPDTGERSFRGVQYKSDALLTTVDGKPIKYRSSTGEPTYPTFLDTGDPDYWSRVRRDPIIPVTLAEGVKKSGGLLTLDHAAISIPGVWNGQKKKVDSIPPFSSSAVWVVASTSVLTPISASNPAFSKPWTAPEGC